MKRVIKTNNVYGTDDKYVLSEEYGGFGIYEEMTPNGYVKHQSWLLSNNGKAGLVIESFNNVCRAELYDIIDNYNKTNKFGVKAVIHCGSLRMHNCGTMA